MIFGQSMGEGLTEISDEWQEYCDGLGVDPEKGELAARHLNGNSRSVATVKL